MANTKFTFSSNMEHPTADDTEGDEGWTAAPAFFEAKLHWLLGHTPDYIECYFHAADQRQFPWVRVRAYDENGIIGIWRFDTIEEQFEGGQRVWRATGRCVLYGAVDNFMRSPRIKADQAVAEDDEDLDDDPNYTEWPILSAKSLMTYEELKARFAEDHFRVTSCGALIEETGCGGPLSPCSGGGEDEEDCDSGKHSHGNFPYCHPDEITHTSPEDSQEEAYIAAGSPCVYNENDDRDAFLLNNFLESRYNVEESKLGPNYAWKGVRRGWVFKDILRHSAGQHDAASRPILGVYNLSPVNDDPITDEGEPIRSNFQQSQVAGVGSNALAYDVAVSWPWIVPEETNEVEDQILEQYEGDSGYDYRTVWPGKADRYAPGGQAVEIFQRGSQEWDDEQAFSCQESIPCPDEGPDSDGVVTYLLFFQGAEVIKFVAVPEFATRATICSLIPRGADVDHVIIGLGVMVTIVDHSLGTYDVSEPGTIQEWTNRFSGLPLLAVNGSIICSGERARPCWCISHVHISGIDTGVIAIYNTPEETLEIAPDDKKCSELNSSYNLAVFLHKTDTNKDYVCYHRIVEE